VLASPLATLARDPRGSADLDKLARLVADREAVEVVVGLPRSLSGKSGPAARAAREYAEALASRIHPVPVRLSDERLTTVAATRRLAEGGIRGRKGRQVVDRSAAVLILQGWLDTARRNS
jgi:putative Holliday junction resolvase